MAGQRLGENALSFRILCLLVATLLAILPLAHVTGLRNTLFGFIAGLAVVHYRTGLWKANPMVRPWMLWLAFAGASIAWSTLPRISFQSFRTDLLYPFVLFVVSFLMVRSSGGRAALAAGAFAGTLMSLATVAGVLISSPEPKADAPGPGILGWLAWKAGDTVDLSTFVAFVAVPLFLILLTSRRTSFRIAAGIWLLIFAGLGIVSESRAVVVSLFTSLACFVIVLGLLRGNLRWRSVALLLGVGLVVSAASVEVISRLRLHGLQPIDRSAAIEMLATDSRPAIWAAYLELAKKHPWFGIGYGRSVPSKTYRLDGNSDIQQIDVHAATHAHNVLLGLVLEVGVFGLAIWLWLHIMLLKFAVQQGRRRGDFEKAWAAAAVALVLAMLVKNFTNDLMVFGNALLFWSLLGAILGLIWWGNEDSAAPMARRGPIRSAAH
jgi:O-antigen ligase